MKFWDTSAIVPLLVEEEMSASCRVALAEDPGVAVWALTRTEATSALQRRAKAGDLTPDDLAVALARLRALESVWTEVDALRTVSERADRLLAVHALTAADALQLASALVLCGERPRGWAFLTGDVRLAGSARAEGFEVPALEIAKPLG